MDNQNRWDEETMESDLSQDDVHPFSSTSFKFVYEQTSINDVANLTPYLACFGLFPEEPLGLYQGVLRFYANKYSFYLLGTKSPFYTNS